MPAELAGIGKVESGHAEGGDLDANGTAIQPILGPVLDGSSGTAAIPATDGGRYDLNIVWARAVGPMQFIPSTWQAWAADGNNDGIADPENVYDATLAAAHYLCANGRDLSTADGLRSAILAYNHSDAYYHLVDAWITAYQQGRPVAVPDQYGALAVGGSGSDAAQSSAGASSTPRTSATTTSSPPTTGPSSSTNPPSSTTPSPTPGMPSLPPLLPALLSLPAVQALRSLPVVRPLSTLLSGALPPGHPPNAK